MLCTKAAFARRCLQQKQDYLPRYTPGPDCPDFGDLPLDTDPFAELLG